MDTGRGHARGRPTTDAALVRRRGRPAAVVAAAAAFVVLASGLVRVPADAVLVLVTRSGAPRVVVVAGWHWRVPGLSASLA